MDATVVSFKLYIYRTTNRNQVFEFLMSADRSSTSSVADIVAQGSNTVLVEHSTSVPATTPPQPQTRSTAAALGLYSAFHNSPSAEFAFYDSHPTSPGYPDASESHIGTPTHPVYRRAAIDYTKFKTKPCRNFSMGLPCQFEDRCAFAHGDERPVFAAPETAATAPPPPSYESLFCSTTASLTPDDDSGAGTPPAYPSRYRFDPYSGCGIIFCEA